MTVYFPPDWFWIVGGDETQIYSSARGQFVSPRDANYLAWLARDGGTRPTHITTLDDLVEELRRHNVPPYHSVSTYRIVRRLEDAGLIDAAEAALESNRALYRRFYTVGMIAADDKNTRAFLTGIGADANLILGPD